MTKKNNHNHQNLTSNKSIIQKNKIINSVSNWFSTQKNLSKKALIAILIFTSFTHLYRLNYPNTYVFDEVYHTFTAKEYLLGHKEAWEWWTTPPPGVAYEWTHPPLAKELMTVSMFITHSTDAWAYRLPGALLGILSVYLVYLLAKQLFKKETTALFSSFIFSLEGLIFVQSRTGMNDVYFVTSMLASFLFFLRKNFFFSSLFLGFALASKWTSIYLLGIYFILLLFLYKQKNLFKMFLEILPKVFLLIFFPIIIYLISYLPFFALGHNFNIFIGLQQQMWWYHTGLKATHDYASPWWSWPLNLYPVWYYVEYHQNGNISNIFATGNPMVFWMGCGAILLTIWDFVKKRSFQTFVILTGFFGFWLPWALSPRIMFLYHYSPSIPFLTIALGYQLEGLSEDKHYKKTIAIILGLMLLGFILFYPILTGIELPKNILEWFFKTNITKNPFG